MHCSWASGFSDNKRLLLKEELKRQLDFVEQWDLSYAKILFDPKGKMADYINKKISPPVDISSASGPQSLTGYKNST